MGWDMETEFVIMTVCPGPFKTIVSVYPSPILQRALQTLLSFCRPQSLFLGQVTEKASRTLGSDLKQRREM